MAGPADNEHLWIGSRSILAGPNVAQIEKKQLSSLCHCLVNPPLDHSGGQGFSSCPEVVCACSLRFSFGSSLSSRADLGSLSSIAVKYLRSKGQVWQPLEKIPLSGWWVDKISENYAIIAVDGKLGYKTRMVLGVNLGERVPQNRFF